MKPLFFASPAEWRRWLVAHHARKDELWVGFHKRSTGKPSLTWPESVDEALCFGWIDGLRKSVDAERYMIRFTPRRTGSIWSAVNVRRVAELTKRRRMRAAGVRAFKARSAAKTAIYSFEQRKTARLPPAYMKQFKANAAAWRFFTAQAPWYQRTTTWWVISAKQEPTRLKRLARLIDDSANGRRIDLMKPTNA
ncbi:MAG: bacteriocin-protection protein [Acidobacteria bacterium 13_1_40CM_65_14]|nr:MAG: bacteriocin-protection protein [Acidobacteria bacterium 13_1_40CM_65_14]